MGRKKKYTEMVGVLFKLETLINLNRVTDELEVSNSEFIRELVEEKIKQHYYNGEFNHLKENPDE